MRRALLWLAAGACLTALLGSFARAPAAGGGDLTDRERQQLEQDELLVKTREAEGYPWPEVAVYRRTAASPEEVMAVYADFESQAGYLPNLVESRILARESRNTFRVFYEYEVSGPNERYTVLATVGRVPRGFRVGWDLVAARYARRLNGTMTVESFGSGALIEYVNRVDPGFFGVHLGSPETTVRQLQETVQVLATYTERLRAERPEKLAALTHALKTLLGAP